MMVLEIIILVKQGEVNGIFDIIPTFPNDEKIEEKIVEALRKDREKDVIGWLVPEENPSKNIEEIDFRYLPTMEKQNLYAEGFPVKIGKSEEIIDAFTCFGSRFGLKVPSVIVEIHKSLCGGPHYWACVYYAADSQAPACIIRAEDWIIGLDDSVKEEIRKKL